MFQYTILQIFVFTYNSVIHFYTLVFITLTLYPFKIHSFLTKNNLLLIYNTLHIIFSSFLTLVSTYFQPSLPLLKEVRLKPMLQLFMFLLKLLLSSLMYWVSRITYLCISCKIAQMYSCASKNVLTIRIRIYIQFLQVISKQGSSKVEQGRSSTQMFFVHFTDDTTVFASDRDINNVHATCEQGTGSGCEQGTGSRTTDFLWTLIKLHIR